MHLPVLIFVFYLSLVHLPVLSFVFYPHSANCSGIYKIANVNFTQEGLKEEHLFPWKLAFINKKQESSSVSSQQYNTAYNVSFWRDKNITSFQTMYFTNLAKLLIKIRIINSQTLHLPKKKHTHTKYFHLYILKYAASFFWSTTIFLCVPWHWGLDNLESKIRRKRVR